MKHFQNLIFSIENNHIRIGKIPITQDYGILTRGKK
jgi:hypothetical protein